MQTDVGFGVSIDNFSDHSVAIDRPSTRVSMHCRWFVSTRPRTTYPIPIMYSYSTDIVLKSNIKCHQRGESIHLLVPEMSKGCGVSDRRGLERQETMRRHLQGLGFDGRTGDVHYRVDVGRAVKARKQPGHEQASLAGHLFPFRIAMTWADPESHQKRRTSKPSFISVVPQNFCRNGP